MLIPIMNIVQRLSQEVSALKNPPITRASILKTCRELVAEGGPEAVSMRSVAQRRQIALGSIYNYFSSKDELVLAAIESVWQDIFQQAPSREHQSFVRHVQWLFDSLRAGIQAYPNFFTAHAFAFVADEKAAARDTMRRFFSQMKQGLLASLQGDAALRPDAFSDSFTREQAADFVLSNLQPSRLRQQTSCDVLLEFIRRALY